MDEKGENDNPRYLKPDVVTAAETAGVLLFHLPTGSNREELFRQLEAHGISLPVREDLLLKFNETPSHAAIVFVCVVVNGKWLAREDIPILIEAAANARLKGREEPVYGRTRFTEFFEPVSWGDTVRQHIRAMRNAIPGEIFSRGGKPAYAESLALLLAGEGRQGVIQFDTELTSEVFRMAIMYLDSLIILRDLLDQQVPHEDTDEGSRYLIKFDLDERVRMVIDGNLTQMGIFPSEFWNLLSDVSMGGRGGHMLLSPLKPQHILVLMLGASVQSEVRGKARRALMYQLFDEIVPLAARSDAPNEREGSFLTIRAAVDRLLVERGLETLRVLVS